MMLIGVLVSVLGAALVFFRFPKHADEERMLREYHAEDAS